MGLAATLLPEFDHEMANTRKSLERVPEDKLDWKPHEKYVHFGSRRNETLDFDGFRRAADGSGEAEPLFRRDGRQFPMLWSVDDSLLLVVEFTRDRAEDFLLMRRDADSVVFTPYLRADWDEEEPALSPNGRWLAYVSEESGAEEVYVRAFPVPSGQWRVSQNGGDQPVWDPGGERLYYYDGTGIVAVEVDIEGTFSFATSERLFAATTIPTRFDPGRPLDIHPDGTRFVIVSRVGEPDSQGNQAAGPRRLNNVVVVTNWFAELRERMGGRD